VQPSDRFDLTSMFSFFRKKPAAEAAPAPAAQTPAAAPVPPVESAGADTPGAPRASGWRQWFTPAPSKPTEVAEPAAPPATPAVPPASIAPPTSPATLPAPKGPPVEAPPVAPPTPAPETEIEAEAAFIETPVESPAVRRGWLDKLRSGLKKTGSSLTQVFAGTQIDDALYDDLEAALLMADAGVKATEFLLADLKRRVRDSKATEPKAVRELLADAIAALLAPLERPLVVGEHTPTVIMVAGVNGAGKTTTIGKLTRHLAAADQKVLLAAADTFRAAAREQLSVWADRNRVEIVSQQGGDPSAVSFDAVKAGMARGCDVVIADTAGRLPTQAHLMDELKKLKRTIGKAMPGAPHEVLLIVDGNTGQNALAQVKAFDEALGLTGLVVTKLDGTAKGGVLAAIALWSRERAQGEAALPVYFVGVGEKLEDLQTFSAREFAQALLG
jgi:fused signal recognition particle receptor